jgi:hypothetical protein
MSTLLALLAACTGAPADTSPTDDTGDSDDTARDDTGGEDACAARGLTARAWDSSGTDGDFDTLAPDFTVQTLDGPWTYSTAFTGCDSVVSIVYDPDADYPNLTTRGDVRDWLDTSPENVDYLLFVDAIGGDARQAALETLEAMIDDAISKEDDPDRQAWWPLHIHYVTDNPEHVDGGDWIGTLNETYQSSLQVNWGIDRFQVVRELGYLADPVTGWATSPPNFLSWQVEYFNVQSDMQDRLDAEGATVLRPFEATDQRVASVEFPDAATMAGFDTLELDLSFICNGHPDASACGEWDYLAYVYLCDNDDPATTDVDESGTCTEIGRFITAYARPGRWTVDATPFLAMLQDGGTHVIRADSANAPFITLDLRLSNQGKGVRPVAMEYLWSGGGFNETYNDGRDPISFTPPAGTTRVDVMALITGHGYGQDRENCAEFCNHEHEFTVNGTQSWTKDEPMAGSDYGCGDQVESGTVPGQYGTWVLGRGGWCPGRQVDPWSADITEAVDLGGENTIAYRGLFEGDTYVPVPYDSGQGFGAVINAATWLVYYR